MLKKDIFKKIKKNLIILINNIINKIKNKLNN